MRIVIDLDGTICPIKQPDQSYSDLPVLPGAVERIRQLRAAGHYIIIQTARNMATRKANVGQVVKHVGKITLDWLEKQGVEYDEIHFGKPNADIYIDDRAWRFNSWAQITDDLLNAHAQER
jgi:capsule biosynthesis phosphatase